MRDGRDLTERDEADELDGVETDRSRCGTASNARDGEVLKDGELGRSSGEFALAFP